MAEELKVLCLSFRTPPAVRPQAILIGKMIREWIRWGLRPVIVTYAKEEKWEIGLPVYQISQFRINGFLNRVPFVRAILKRRYYKKLVSTVGVIVKKHGINLIFSFSNPQESNILGAMLKENSGVKFIAYFSDPWYDNPLEEFSLPWARRKMLNHEKFVVASSDRIIFCNRQTKNLVMKKYPESWFDKARVVPHCYELEDYPEVEKKAGGKFVFSYIGVFYRLRNPEIFFKALRCLLDREPGLGDKFKVRLIGAVNNYTGYSEEKINRMIDDYGLKDQIEIISAVGYEESLKYMKLSDCLVVIDADIPGSPFLPSKVVDYAGSGSTIIGITPDGSPTGEFLNNLGYKAFNHGQTDKLSIHLEELISGKIKINLNQDFLNQYDVCRTTEKLIGIFREVKINKI